MSAKAKLKYVLFGAVFAGGFASLSLELAVMRQLSGFVGSTAVTASIIIGVLLAFMSLGYYRGSTVSIRRNRIRQVLAPDFIVIALMSVLASSYILIDLYFWAMNGLGIRSNVDAGRISAPCASVSSSATAITRQAGRTTVSVDSNN